jgi:DNA-binding response OmpR family regulator
VSAVLLVEDDELLRHGLRASLHAWQFDVLKSDTGENALTLVASRAAFCASSTGSRTTGIMG